MVLDRLKQVAQHVAGTLPQPHPFDPLSAAEIETAVSIVRKEHSSLYYNAVTLHEPRKAAMMAWLADPDHAPRPHRVADIVAIGRGSKVFDGLVDLVEGKILRWESAEGVQPLVWKCGLVRECWLMVIDYDGGPADRGTCRAERSKGYRAVRPLGDPARGYAQGLLRS